MKISRKTSETGATARPLQRLLHAVVIAASLGTLAGLSFVFLPAGPREGDRDHALKDAVSAPHAVDDRSPLRGLALKIPDLTVRRLDQLAVVTFTCEVFDDRQNLKPAARDRLELLAQKLREVRSHVAVEVTGYAPENEGSNGYSVGLLRASCVADCLVTRAGLPPSAIALRSLGDTEVRGRADQPHGVVIVISNPDGEASQLARIPVARL